MLIVVTVLLLAWAAAAQPGDCNLDIHVLDVWFFVQQGMHSCHVVLPLLLFCSGPVLDESAEALPHPHPLVVQVKLFKRPSSLPWWIGGCPTMCWGQAVTICWMLETTVTSLNSPWQLDAAPWASSARLSDLLERTRSVKNERYAAWQHVSFC